MTPEELHKEREAYRRRKAEREAQQPEHVPTPRQNPVHFVCGKKLRQSEPEFAEPRTR